MYESNLIVILIVCTFEVQQYYRLIVHIILLLYYSVERHVTLSRSSSSGYPIKMIGGKTVGVFISDVRSDVTQVIYSQSLELYNL